LRRALLVRKKTRPVFEVNLEANSISAEEAAAVGAGEDPCGVTVIGWREEPQRAARERPRGDAPTAVPDDPERAAAGRNVRTSNRRICDRRAAHCCPSYPRVRA